jgi:surfeit locus 1 family protein
VSPSPELILLPAVFPCGQRSPRQTRVGLLQVENGPVVFINRGFVPTGMGWKAPAIATPEGLQTITGLMRLSEKRQTFTPQDVPAKGEYFVRDVQTMARAVSISQAAPFFIDAERQGDDVRPPVGVNANEMIARIPNNHLQYAVTWFGFAVTLLGVFGFFAYGRLKDHAALSQSKGA